LKKILVSIMLLLLNLSPIVSAKAPQGDPGILVGRDWIVYAVNLGGPADVAGIKPGDKILSINGKPTDYKSLEILQDEYTESVGKTITGIVLSKGEEKPISITLRQLTDDEFSTFLVMGNANTVFTTVIDVLTFDNAVATLFPIQFTDKASGIIRTQGSAQAEGKLIRKLIKSPMNYNGASLNALDVGATFRIREVNNDYSAVRTAFAIRVQAVSIFVGARWYPDQSNGSLEKELMTRMYNATKTANFVIDKNK